MSNYLNSPNKLERVIGVLICMVFPCNPPFIPRDFDDWIIGLNVGESPNFVVPLPLIYLIHLPC